MSKDSSEKEPTTEKQKDESPKKVGYSDLYRYATPWDKFLIILGTVCGMVNGAGLPVMTIVFGDILSSFVLYSQAPNDANRIKLEDDTRKGVLYFTVIGAAIFVASYGQLCFWMMAGENQAKRIRQLYFKAILRQDIGWFDKTSTGDLTTRMVADTSTIQEGMSDKVGLMIQFTCTFISGFIIAFTKGWKLALVLCSVFPLLAGAAFILSKTLSSGTSQQSDAYASAGDLAQQVISSMKTVSAFGGEKRAIRQYEERLRSAEKAGVYKAISNGLGVGVLQGIIFLVYSLGFWYGNILVTNEGMDAGQVLNVFFAIVIGAFSLGQATPYLSALGNAQGAAFKIFETLDRSSPIDASSPSGKKLEKLDGKIVFKDIQFHYPSRPDVSILSNFSLVIESGKTVALVGSSGSGKSTIVKLLERFYDPVSGSVTLDGNELSTLNVKWLRQQIGIVSQEPALFDTTIRQNLLYGFTENPENSSQDELEKKIIEACKMANAWDFIQRLPDGLDTVVGESGSMLSGGQKQRIAIARALIKNPKILLLDEATSALDTASERTVQEALDNASKNRTTVVIAHRLSTIKNADLIVVMQNGAIIEQGTHNQLLDKKGMYFKLTETQKIQESGLKETKDLSMSKSQESRDTDATATVEDVHPLKGKSASMNSLKRKKLQEEKEKAQVTERLKQKVDISRLLKLNKSEWWCFVVGIIASCANGVVMPLFAIIFTSILTALGTDKANFWALMFVVLAAAAFISNVLQTGLFKYAGEKLTCRLRLLSFEAILKQELGFFDDDKNSTGVLTVRLAEDASLAQGITGPSFGGFAQAFAGLVAGLAIAFANSWQLTLVVLATVPLIGLAGYFQFRSLTGYGQAARAAYEDAGQIACEAIENIRTVATLTQEDRFSSKYEEAIRRPHKTAIRGALISSFGYGFSQGVLFWSWAVAFYYGSKLIYWNLYSSENILKVMFAIIFTATAAGQVSNLMPDSAKAKLAALNIFELLDRVSKIDYSDPKGEKRDVCRGQADLVNVRFSYPTRPDTQILNGLELAALPGKTVALVGPSGCGKSTVLGILERWYDISGGNATVDELEVRDWNLTNLRSHMALVGQEPTLFNTSIRENIAYGLPGEASQTQIETAAKLANIHEFVMSLPEGYNTIVGEKGGQLSGGQKQRVAIARALIRNPKILLLDEATSALDSESEKVVQHALDEAAKGRTTIVIAHRLSTIQNADMILVIKDGKVIEQGTHGQLVDLKGMYYELSIQQSLQRT